MNRSIVRLLLATLGVPAFAAAGGWLVKQVLAARVPDPVAVHWGLDGPDRAASLTNFTAATLGISSGLALLGTGLAVAARHRGGPTRAVVAFDAGLACFPAATLIGTLLGNLNLTNWQQAPAPVGVVIAMLGTSVAGAALAFLVAGPNRTLAPPPAVAVPATGAEHLTWSGGTTNRLLVWAVLPVPVALVTVVLVGGTEIPTPLYIAVAVVGLIATLGLGRLTATADRTGVSVRLGLLGWPRGHIPLAEIARAEVAALTLWGAGGLGYRMNAVTGDVAYKLRGGQALALVLRSGRKVFITVDAADAAAATVNELLGRASQSDSDQCETEA